nr:vegetative cell wall protein gp1-like [Aegilops tauschii subsp. strangulata]
MSSPASSPCPTALSLSPREHLPSSLPVPVVRSHRTHHAAVPPQPVVLRQSPRPRAAPRPTRAHLLALPAAPPCSLQPCRARCSASVATVLLRLLAPAGSPPPCWPSFARPALRRHISNTHVVPGILPVPHCPIPTAPVSTFPLPSPSPSCVVTALTTPPSRHSPPSCASPRGLARPHDPRARTSLLCLLPRRAPRSLAETAALPPSPRPCSACSRHPAPRRRAGHPSPAPLSGVWPRRLRPPRPRPPGLARPRSRAVAPCWSSPPLSLADSLRPPRSPSPTPCARPAQQPWPAGHISNTHVVPGILPVPHCPIPTAPVSTFPLPSPSPSCVVTALTTPPSRHSPPSCASPRGLARPHDPRARTSLLCLLPRRAPRSLAETAALPPSPRPCSACSRHPAPRRRAGHPSPAPLSGVWPRRLRPPRPRPPGLARPRSRAVAPCWSSPPLSLADSLRPPRSPSPTPCARPAQQPWPAGAQRCRAHPQPLHPAGRHPAPVRRCPGPPRPGDLGKRSVGHRNARPAPLVPNAR